MANRFFESIHLYRSDGQVLGLDFERSFEFRCNTGFFIGGAWGDYDNDGDLDLFVAREGQGLIFRNDQDAGFSRTVLGDRSCRT